MKSSCIALYSVFAAIGLSGLLASCGEKKKKTTDESGVGVSGKLVVSSKTTLRGAGLNQLVPTFFNDTFHVQSTKADKVTALPMYKNLWQYMGGSLANNLVTGDIAADGSFNIQFPDTTNPYLIVAYDSTNTNKYESVVGVITMSAVVESLVKMPVDKANGDIDLGKAESGGEGDQQFKSEKKVDDIPSVRDVKGTLNEMAKVDKSSLHMKNAFVNSGTSETWIAQPYHSFSGNILSVRDTYSATTDYAYDGHGIYFSTNAKDLDINKICGAASDPSAAQKIEMVPPEAVTLKIRNFATWPPTDKSFSITSYDNLDTSAVQTSGTRKYCGNSSPNDYSHGGIYFYEDSQGGNVTRGWNWGGGAKAGPMPSGKFVLKVDGTERAAFELASGSPVNSDKSLNIYVPLIKAKLNSAGAISGVDVKFVTYNSETKSYDTITDTTVLNSTISNLMLSINNWNGSCGSSEGMYTDKTEVDGVLSFTGMESNGFVLPAATSGFAVSTCTAQAISLSYEMNYNTYHFSLRPVYE